MSALKLSVVVCTHNNAPYLRKALASLVVQDMPEDEYEIVVVDNASTDGTAEAAAGFPQARCVHEDRLGLSIARNRGIRAARGPVVAFMDDDAEADPGWVRALLACYEGRDDVWAAGGKALPIWGGPVPEWLTETHHRSLSLIDLGEAVRPLSWPERVIGVNCSFRKAVFREFGLFDECLGRIGQALLGHEDTEIQQRIHRAGRLVVYTPHAVVNHHVPASRMTEEYFSRRSKGTLTSERILELRRDSRDVEAAEMASVVRRKQVDGLGEP